jgi:hypothetical protein
MEGCNRWVLNWNFKFFLQYCWVQNVATLKYHPRYPKRGKALRNFSFIYTPTSCTKTTYQNFVSNDFNDFCVLIESSKELKAYALYTYLNFAHFLDS